MKINIHVLQIVKGPIIQLYHGHLDGTAFLPSNKDMGMMPIGQMLTINLIFVWAPHAVYNFQIVPGIGIQMLTVYVIHIM